jgi:hypothetical protein
LGFRVNRGYGFALNVSRSADRRDAAITMPDAFVYYFLVRDRTTGKLVSSKRRATLEAIKSKGEALLESQMAVDASEVDATGFLVSRSVGGADPSDELWGEIRSLRLRADSREREAKQLNETSDRDRKLILCAEGRELRSRAERLQQLIQAGNKPPFTQAFQKPMLANESSTTSDFFKAD